jgi:hypothetical protein
MPAQMRSNSSTLAPKPNRTNDLVTHSWVSSASHATVFVTLWRDVTYRSKVIALCGRLGPHYLAKFAALKKKVAEEANESTKGLNALIIKILMADDPERPPD